MSRTLAAVLNEANPNKLPVAAQVARLGSVLKLSPAFVRGAVASNVLALPEGRRAVAILYAYAVAGTVTGQLTPVVGPAPATTEVGITDDGQIAFQATDAVTEAEVVYVSAEGEIFEEVIPIATNVGTPLASRKGLILLEAEALVGTVTGVAAVEARGTTPGTGEAALTDEGDVEFAAADAVTSARVKYVAAPGIGTAKAAVVPALSVEDKDF